MDLSNVALVTHRGCLDGSTCAIVFQVAGGKKENIHFSFPRHEEVDELVSYLVDTWEGPILMADISVSPELAKRIDARGQDVTILDHHASASLLDQYEWCSIDLKNERCGSKMLYDFLYTTGNVGKNGKLVKYKNLINVVDDQDRWVRSMPESETLAVLHNTLKQKRFIDRFIRNPSMDLTIQELYLLDLERSKKADYVQGKKNAAVVLSKLIDEEYVRIAYVISDEHPSTLGHSICSDPTIDVDIAVLVGPHSISMRSSQDCQIDLSKVAKSYGGGGHKHAAGLSLSSVLGDDLLETVMKKMEFKKKESNEDQGRLFDDK